MTQTVSMPTTRSADATREPAKRHRPMPRPTVLALLLATVVVGVQALLVPLFAGPAANLAPRDLPVIVAGPAPAAEGFAERLRAARPGAFSVRTIADSAAADDALRDREAYAAFVLGPDGPSLHTASAASPVVAGLLTEAAGRLAEGRDVPVVDVVPTDVGDPRGAGFAAGFLPLVMTALLAGLALFLLVHRRAARLTGLVAFAAASGLVGAAVMQYWLGVLPGDYALNAAVLGLFALAAAGTVTGLAAVLGRPGIALGVLAVFLIGNPLSAVGSAPELLPQPWGEVGQWLPAGAGGTLLRSVAYFDGAGGGFALAVLSAYAVMGLLLVLVGRARAGHGATPA